MYKVDEEKRRAAREVEINEAEKRQVQIEASVWRLNRRSERYTPERALNSKTTDGTESHDEATEDDKRSYHIVKRKLCTERYVGDRRKAYAVS
jgi:hypothetical protein